jgi:hypothetical protein
MMEKVVDENPLDCINRLVTLVSESEYMALKQGQTILTNYCLYLFMNTRYPPFSSERRRQ